MRYLVLVLILEFSFLKNGNSQCSTPGPGYVSNITSTAATFNYSCCSQGYSYYVEYGPSGFTPGVADTAGTGGTLVNMTSGQGHFTITGFSPLTTYIYYVRVHCSNGSWSLNSAVNSFTTSPDCSTAPMIYCNTLVTLNAAPGSGVWYAGGVACDNGYGKELLFRFTASQSGNHVLFCTSGSGQNAFSYYYKADSLPCSTSSWNCIGSPTWFGGNQQFSFGPLTAGITYYILADVYNDNTPPSQEQFRIECPICAPPPAPTIVKTTPISIDISLNGNLNAVEYGPQGYIPGTGNGAGAGGHTVYVSGNNVTISNLSPNTLYDIYTRANCGNGSYSPNSTRITAHTDYCPNFYTYTQLGNSWYNSHDTYYWDYYPSCSMFTPGPETFIRFTAPSSGYYDVTLSSTMYSYTGYNLLYRTHDSICNLTNYTCAPIVVDDQYNDLMQLGPLIGGTTYDLILDVNDTSAGTTCVYRIDCPKPRNIIKSNIGPTSLHLEWECNCPNATYLEYGPPGFVPGTDDGAGTNGTIIYNVSSPYTLTGLVADTKYDVYLRSKCGGNFSSNTSRISFQTAQRCTMAPQVSCSDHLIFCADYGITGAWANNACSNTYNLSKEGIWQFTPTQTGDYSIFVYGFYANSIYYSYPANFYIKDASLGCNELNWTCAGTMHSSIHGGTHPAHLPLGTLTAGHTYYILADGIDIIFTQGYCYFFRIDCFNVCPQPILSSVSDITLDGATIYAVCDSCQGDITLEYGPSGFTPGIGATAGAGGTVVTSVFFPYTITGLPTGVAYDVYARANCGSQTGFSINSSKKTFTPCSIGPTAISSNMPGNSICAGSSITLTQVGGALASGGNYKWYTGYCGSTFVGTGNSITVTPANTTTYYLRAEASCGSSICRSLQVGVMPGPNATATAAGPVVFCAGDSVRLNANTGTGITYQWLKNGAAIAGATSNYYYAIASGAYAVQVTNNCSALISAPVNVIVNKLPSAAITANGSTTFCSGQSVTLTALYAGNRGYQYQWKKNTNDIAGANAPSYTATKGGNYRVNIKNTLTGCAKTTGSATTVAVNALPASVVTPLGPTTFCAGGSVELQANTGTGLTYQWKKGNGNIGGATLQNYTATTAGTYKVVVTNTNSCSKISSGITVSVPCREGLAATSENDFNISVFPNPANTEINVEFNADEHFTIEIIDAVGHLVAKESSTKKIDISNLTPGVYFIKVFSGRHLAIRKFSKI